MVQYFILQCFPKNLSLLNIYRIHTGRINPIQITEVRTHTLPLGSNYHPQKKPVVNNLMKTNGTPW